MGVAVGVNVGVGVGLSVGMGAGGGVTVALGVGLDVGVDMGPTRIWTSPATVRSCRSLLVTTPEKVYWPSTVGAVTT